jgi:predicted CopG family antitoxin
MEATSIRISKLTHKRLTDLARKNQSYDNLINEILDRNERLFDLNDIDGEYESHLENIIKEDNFNEYENDEEFINAMRG